MRIVLLSYVEKTLFYWHKNRYKPTLIRSANVDKGGKSTQRGEVGLFSEWCWENCSSTCKRVELDPCLTPYPKVNSKWIKDLNLRHETIKLLGKKKSKVSRTLA